MNWPFLRPDHKLAAEELDRSSQLRGNRITSVESDLLRVTFENGQFAIRQKGALIHQCKTARQCKRYLSRHYRDMVYDTPQG
jgi:hypothetical protein